MVVSHDQQIPPLLRTVIPRKREGRAHADIGARQSSVDKNICKEHLQGPHLRPTSNSATRTGIDLAPGDLLLLLPGLGHPRRLAPLVGSVHRDLLAPHDHSEVSDAICLNRSICCSLDIAEAERLT